MAEENSGGPVAKTLPGADPWAGYQSRYVAYCKVHGAASPDEMLARDHEAYPGGCMTGYLCWIMARWEEWKAMSGHKYGTLSQADHAAFDLWLVPSSCAGCGTLKPPKSENNDVICPECNLVRCGYSLAGSHPTPPPPDTTKGSP